MIARLVAPWWRRLFASRKRITEYCARCGCVRGGTASDQKLPRGTREVCCGTFNFRDGHPFCVRLGIRWD